MTINEKCPCKKQKVRFMANVMNAENIMLILNGQDPVKERQQG